MSKSGRSLQWMVAVLITLVLTASGCATKKYVRTQTGIVNQRVSQVETQVNEQMAALSSKEQSDISQVNERIATTDQKLAQVASTAQQANATALQAKQQAEANQSKIAANSGEIATLGAGVANAMNYQLVEKGDVTFGFNKSNLTPEAKLALDQIAQKVQSLPRAVVEVAGFTDQIGSSSYNMALSRRRAQAVEAYLVQQKVPLRDIHIVGLGEEPPPEGLTADLLLVDPNPSQKELNRLARRVRIRVFGAGDITQGTAARTQP